VKFQWSKVASVLGSYKDFIHAYGLSVNSANFSQRQIADQLDTIDRRLQQLKATFTSVATGVGSSGLSKFIKDTLVNINALVQAFQRVPSGVYSAIATMIKWGTLLVGTVGTLSLVAKGIVGMQMALKAATTAQAAETLATNVSTASKVRDEP
jgi:phage-related protein